MPASPSQFSANLIVKKKKKEEEKKKKKGKKIKQGKLKSWNPRKYCLLMSASSEGAGEGESQAMTCVPPKGASSSPRKGDCLPEDRGR